MESEGIPNRSRGIESRSQGVENSDYQKDRQQDFGK
jgi:hypothetical protein